MPTANVYLSFQAVALAPGAPTAPIPVTTVRGGYFRTVPGRNTPLLIAGAPSSRSPTVDHRILAGRICSDPKNNPVKGTSIRLRGKSLSFPIRPGVNVWVPQHVGATLDVMVGDNPPQPAAGYADWAETGRPLQRPVTIFQQYSSRSLQVEVRFGKWSEGSWLIDDANGQRVEDDIAKLEWMAGVTLTAGSPPAVYVYSYNAQGGQTTLIPATYQGRAWVIVGGIQWGKSYRNANGYRIWQDASFMLKEYLGVRG